MQCAVPIILTAVLSMSCCDIYGLYVIDETNLETHGTWMKNGGDFPDEYTLPDGHAQWQGAVLQRAANMLQRDKNHPAIIIWSCGNESFGGETIFKMHEYFHKADASRLVHYEDFSMIEDSTLPVIWKARCTPMWLISRKFLAEHRDKPFICCEY